MDILPKCGVVAEDSDNIDIKILNAVRAAFNYNMTLQLAHNKTSYMVNKLIIFALK